jgi:hypothetical protein
MLRVLLLLLLSVTLAGCVTPMRLGISEATWQNYSSEERKKIKEGYYELLKSRFGRKEEKVISDGGMLNVRISGGQVAMPPFVHLSDYNQVDFDILSGNCRTVQVQGKNSNKKVALKVCYLNKILYLDPSPYDPKKRLGSIQLHYSPIWDRGFVYQRISSSGYVRLTHANVAVRKYDNNAARSD